MRKINYLALAISIAIAELTGAFSAFLSGNIEGTYKSFVQPPLSPPAIVFPITWIILYALMGAAAYFVWDSVRGSDSDKKNALIFYTAQLFVNFLWSIIFFRFEAYWLAVLVIIILDILVIITMVLFRRINKFSFWLFIPYILWLLFATYLNIGVAVLN